VGKFADGTVRGAFVSRVQGHSDRSAPVNGIEVGFV
jgi:hypothetical protein